LYFYISKLDQSHFFIYYCLIVYYCTCTALLDSFFLKNWHPTSGVLLLLLFLLEQIQPDVAPDATTVTYSGVTVKKFLDGTNKDEALSGNGNTEGG